MNAESDNSGRNPVTIEEVHPKGEEPFVEVTIDVAPARSRIDFAKRLAGVVEFVNSTPVQVFNRLIHGSSATQRGLAKRDSDITLENARRIRGRG